MPLIIPFNSEHLDRLAREIADYIADGKIVAIPTDTCYGLATDATNPSAVRKVFEVKRRPLTKPLSVFLYDKTQIPIYASIHKTAMRFINLLPQRLTLILRAKESDIVKELVIKNNKIGIRIPLFMFPRLIVRHLGKPITATSANIHGYEPIYDSAELHKLEGIDVIVDCKRLEKIAVSTVIDVSEENKIVVLREGAIRINELCKMLGELPNNLKLIVS